MYRVARLAGLVILFAPFASGDDVSSPTPADGTGCIDGQCSVFSPLAVVRSGVNPGVSCPAPSRSGSSARLTPSRRLFLRRPFRLLQRRCRF